MVLKHTNARLFADLLDDAVVFHEYLEIQCTKVHFNTVFFVAHL